MKRMEYPPKTCKVCGTEFHRRPDEHAGNYKRRVVCSKPCHTIASNKQRHNRPRAYAPHEPCIVCHKPMHPRDGEKPHRFKERTTCSPDCKVEAMRRTRKKLGLGGSKPRARQSPDERRARENARKRAWRAERQKIAPEGYKWAGKFPTPEGMKATWVSITGPELPPAQPKRTTGPKVDLRNVLEEHPDLAAALAGILTDSWFPYSRSSSVKGASTDT
jgi:hypothetical protein